MSNAPRPKGLPFRKLTGVTGRFFRDESGTITILACFMVFMMVMVCGIGVDIMRHEMERNRIQSVADRAVLAAADLDQTLDPEEVVRDYFAKSGMADFVADVQISEGLNYRTVTVDARAEMNTQFLDTFGVETLGVPATSTADERVGKVEISLVLDISGSMANNSKMQNLQDAAEVFLDTVLADTNQDLISISLIPYSEHVNAGPRIFNRLNVNKVHNYSHCIEFPDSEFNSTVLDTSLTYAQMQHYQWNYYSNESGNQLNTRYDTVCPRRGYERIVAMSQDLEYLKGQVRKFKPRAGTSIFLGMKWAAALLDPAFRPVTQQMISRGHVEGVFASRPADYSDDDTLKTVILMTDGQNDRSYRIASNYYNSDSERVHWNNYNFQYYLYNYVYYSYRWRYYWQKYTASHGDTLLNNVCNAAKDANIVIWTIGFEVQDHGANVMRDCASSPSHFFRVESVQIHDAFSAIARQIRQLRLIQ